MVGGTVNYDAFGQVVGTTGSSGSSYMYGATSGYRNDWDGGLMHVSARYYDPQVGRFVTPDSFLSENPFLYCEHDPVNRLDPDGHKPTKRFWNAILTFVGVGGTIIWTFGTAPVTIPTLIGGGLVAVSVGGFGIVNDEPGPWFDDPPNEPIRQHWMLRFKGMGPH